MPEWQQAIWIGDDGTTLWAVGAAGQIARSIDGGHIWSPICLLYTSGPIEAPSSYFMKSPPKQFTDDEARQLVEEYAWPDGIPSAPDVIDQVEEVVRQSGD